MDAILNSGCIPSSAKLISCVYVNHRVVQTSDQSNLTNSTFNVPVDFSFVGIREIITAHHPGFNFSSITFANSKIIYFSKSNSIVYPICVSYPTSSSAGVNEIYWMVSSLSINLQKGNFSWCDKSDNGSVNQYIFPGLQLMFYI